MHVHCAFVLAFSKVACKEARAGAAALLNPPLPSPCVNNGGCGRYREYISRRVLVLPAHVQESRPGICLHLMREMGHLISGATRSARSVASEKTLHSDEEEMKLF